jgi:hypothetical protein
MRPELEAVRDWSGVTDPESLDNTVPPTSRINPREIPPFAERLAHADRIFCTRVTSWLARRYGEELEHPACPAVLREVVHEHTAVELGEEFAAIRGRVDTMLEQVECVEREGLLGLAQAWAILARIQAGEFRNSRSLREAFARVIEALDAAASADAPYRGAEVLVFREISREVAG